RGFSGGSSGAGFSDFFELLFGGGRGPGGARGGGAPFSGFGGGFSGFPGGFDANLDQHVTLALTLEEAAGGGLRELTVRDSGTGESKTLSVNLPRGIREGQKLRLAGKGMASPDGRSGDLYLQVGIRPHSRFRLDGIDIHTSLPVTPWQAALGGEVPVRTLDGTLKVKVPKGSSTGRKIRLRGKGFPNPKGNDGDLFAEIKVMVPQDLTDRERELFEELAEISTFRPR
ncbi:MAG: HSP40/DnaJ peptide-binding protein, partial [Holophagales bacterium]|nr:HSP40/DnaJ peptide-binding protein [Holophagales bacterium]